MADRHVPPAVVHTVTVETRTHRERRGLEIVEYEQQRRVCSCGAVTSWHRDFYLARRKMDRHALDGQTALL